MLVLVYGIRSLFSVECILSHAGIRVSGFCLFLIVGNELQTKAHIGNLFIFWTGLACFQWFLRFYLLPFRLGAWLIIIPIYIKLSKLGASHKPFLSFVILLIDLLISQSWYNSGLFPLHWHNEFRIIHRLLLTNSGPPIPLLILIRLQFIDFSQTTHNITGWCIEIEYFLFDGLDEKVKLLTRLLLGNKRAVVFHYS